MVYTDTHIGGVRTHCNKPAFEQALDHIKPKSKTTFFNVLQLSQCNGNA